VIVGDWKSSDMFTCQIAHYNQPRMSRACYTSFKDCNNSAVECKWVTREEQRSLQEKLLRGDAENNESLMQHLRDVSTYRCWSKMVELDFGSNPNGQFLACTVDPMHLFEGGWIAMVCKAFAKSLSKNNSGKLNRWAFRYVKCNRTSVRKRFPRVDFSGGITKITNIASHEWPGILLVYLLAASSVSANKFLRNHFDDNDNRFMKKVHNHQQAIHKEKKRQKLLKESGLQKKHEVMLHGIQDELHDGSDDDDLYLVHPDQPIDDNIKMTRCTRSKFINMCESLLTFHAFYKKGIYWERGDITAVKDFTNSIRTMMEMVISTIDRGDKTNNWNIQKFHEILHLPKQIVEYGSINNTDAGFGERGLKYWAKRPGRRALKGNVEIFTASTIQRILEHVCLRKAAQAVSDKEDYHIASLPLRDDSSNCSSFNIQGENIVEVGLMKDDAKDESPDSLPCPVLETINANRRALPKAFFPNRHKFMLQYKDLQSWENETSYESNVNVTTMHYVKTKTPLNLPRDIVDLYEDKYFSELPSECDPVEIAQKSICVYTEIKMSITGENI
jgi:hypothetical protein